MQQLPVVRRYSSLAQLFHWLTVIGVSGAWILGTFGDELPRGPVRHTGELIHVFLGEAILLLLVTRLIWRFISPPPNIDPAPGRAIIFATSVTHIIIYLLLLAVPVAGIFVVFSGGEALSIFGAFDITSPWQKSRELKHNVKEIHEFLANALLALAALHAAAALAHHYFLRDNTLKRMLPAALMND